MNNFSSITTIFSNIASAINAKGVGGSMVPAEMASKISDILTPSGNIQLTQSTTTDVTHYATATVKTGSVSVSNDTITKNPSIVLNNFTGMITASYSSSKTISPNVTEGWVSSGTSGTIRTSGTSTLQLLTQSAKTITPTNAQQTAVESERYTTGNVVVEAVPDEMKSISTNDVHTPAAGKWFSYVDVYVPDFDLMAARSIVNASGRASVIGSYAFVHCTLLETCDFPNVTSISTSAFSTCTKLTTISFPACQNIGTYAFRGCTGLTTVSFPACKVIQSNAFSGCTGITDMHFSVLSQIQSYAFRGCTKLSEIYLLGSSVCALVNSNAFSSTSIASTKGAIYVPSSLYNSYKTATNWTRFSARMHSVST